MPSYDYEIITTGEIVTVEQSIKEPAHTILEIDGELRTVRRVISPSTFLLKGSCWAKDGYQ
jgi:predicted nucleic acid-binding Zn ribbon protein